MQQLPKLIMKTELLESEQFKEQFAIAECKRILAENWKYTRVPIPEIDFVDRIVNFSQTQLISSEQTLPLKSNFGKCLQYFQQFGDFKIVTIIQYKATEKCNKSRKHAFHFNFHHKIIIAYYPESGLVKFNKYHDSFNTYF